MKLSSWDIAIIATSIIVLVGSAFTVDTSYPWIGQDLAGVPSMLFLIAAVLFGATLVGRLKRPLRPNLFSLHRKIGVFFAALIVVAFIHGLYDRTRHGELFFWQHTTPLVTVVHGWFGLLVMVLALAQVIPSLATRDRRMIRKLHKILGYTLIIMIIIQIFLGIWTVLIEAFGG